MEEADALSQRIGIMAQGSLRCLGSPLHLKNKLGKGYQLTVTLEDAESELLKQRRRAFEELVKKEVSQGAVVQEAFKGERVLSLILPKEALHIERVFDLVQEKNLKEYAISEWSIAQTSLNEVFLRIVEKAEEESGNVQNRSP
jgi:ABC-type multidrug transport system ATPase subunit